MQNWQPSASHEALKHRAAMLATIREFFSKLDVLEVETPLLAEFTVTEPSTDSFGVNYDDEQRYLQTSPEYAMKRLLASGIGSIYQICKAFRLEPAGQFHNPEFTMLEWYRPGYSYNQLIVEACDLLSQLLNCEKVEELTYQALFQQVLAINPHEVSLTEIHRTIQKHSINIDLKHIHDIDVGLSLLLTHLIEPTLPKDTIVVVKDFPASQASLAQLSKSEPVVAQRFEIYFNGQELANGFQELTDATLQSVRFNTDNDKRAQLGKPLRQADQFLLAALEEGLPHCSGIAIGLDRVLLCQQNYKSLADVLAFPFTC